MSDTLSIELGLLLGFALEQVYEEWRHRRQQQRTLPWAYPKGSVFRRGWGRIR